LPFFAPHGRIAYANVTNFLQGRHRFVTLGCDGVSKAAWPFPVIKFRRNPPGEKELGDETV
jgi:hypothetical protein